MITDLWAARSQMAISLGFHIIFACIGMTMPFLMAFSHGRWLRSRDPIDLELTKAWSKGVAIFFATGAVSGTVLSFELGLLWPGFMREAGGIIGMPFSWEGTAFFIEAIALGFFLYGWQRLPPRVHWLSGLVVGLSGLASGLFVVCANAWMNSPAGFTWENGRASDIDPWSAMFNAMAMPQGVHMLIGAFQATGFAVAGLHAFLLLRQAPRPELHRRAVKIALPFAALASLMQPLAGHWLAQTTAERQPLKLAAMEGLFSSQRRAPLVIGGLPDEDSQTVHWGLELPALLSVLAHGDPDAVVMGLDAFPRDEWPPLVPVHLAFQVMVGLGTLMAFVSLVAAWQAWRRPGALVAPPMLTCLALCTPLGFIAVEAGWVVTEVGRQPWIIYQIMRTSEALTPVPGLVVSLVLFTGVYLGLSLMLIVLLRRQIGALSSSRMPTT